MIQTHRWHSGSRPHPECPGARTTFTATGTAVDHAILHADGQAEPRQTLHADTGLGEADDPPLDGDVLWVTIEFTCADGSGDFVLSSEATVDNDQLECVIETGELSSVHPSPPRGQQVVRGHIPAVTVATPGGFEDGVFDISTGTLAQPSTTPGKSHGLASSGNLLRNDENARRVERSRRSVDEVSKPFGDVDEREFRLGNLHHHALSHIVG